MEHKSVTYTTGLSLSSIGIIVGIVLCILQGIGTIDIGWFWATVPFWIVPAAGIAIILLIILVSLIIAIFAGGKDK